MKVKNMTSSRGNPVPNQFVIEDTSVTCSDGATYNGDVFQSYDSIISVRCHNGEVYLDTDTWDYSVTTGRYRNGFLGEGVAETRKKISSGEYQLRNLNR